MRSVKILLVVGLVCFAGSSAMGGWLNNNFDLGDIGGGYNTGSYSVGNDSTMTSMSAYINGGHYKIDSAGVSIYPNFDYAYNDHGDIVSQTLDGYRIDAYIQGEISTQITPADQNIQSQNNSFNARGLNISEQVWMAVEVYQTSPNGGLQFSSYANVSLNVQDFHVNYANGNYVENTWGGLGASPDAGGLTNITDFNYNVVWYGDFLPGHGPISSFSGMRTSVPEPGTFALLGIGLVGGLAIYRRRRSRN